MPGTGTPGPEATPVSGSGAAGEQGPGTQAPPAEHGVAVPERPAGQDASPEPEPEPEPDPAAPAPLGVERVPTGYPEVDARLRRLADADHLATDEHLAVYEDVHRGLRDALTALDAHPGPPAPPPRPGGSEPRS